jgi:hypothetical protein|nr:DUF3307 domain-containing protein [Neorhizobium tomejilense]
MAWPELLFFMVFLHYLGDFGLQTAHIAHGKNRIKPLEGCHWFHPMMAHCTIHGGFVYFATGSLILGLLETAVHFLIDDSKCNGRFGEHVDQALHIACKVLWLVIFFNFPEFVP